VDKILWFDTETTGLDPRRHGIIQLACIVDIGGQIVEEKEFKMFHPGKEIDPEAMKVHGITEKELHEYPSYSVVKLQVEDLLGGYVNRYDKSDKFVPAGYNVRFDIDFLKGMWESCGDKFLFSWINPRQTIDPFTAYPFLEWAGIVEKAESHKLERIAKSFDVEFDAHDALADIRATREVAYKIRDMLDRRGTK